ncbi:PDZ and LIM domain protein 3-like isoform X2 [Macrobrachium nipponense]|uniref:PDZ and LIM domain protein 3-like isoform X2 n=1 Tax=Macrobrachium nipponense TaxID=159736 RepID=UPI0030C8CB77
MSGVISLVLERDGHDQPWGFRLQGGADVALPLSVQRVLVGSPADGTLLKGDIITRISCTDTKGITHQQAADLFNNAGNQIAIHVKRPGVVVVPAGAQPATAAPLVNGSPGQAAAPAPAPPTPENPAVRSLPKTTFVHKASFLPPQKKPLANMETLSIQSQPYRTLPLVQPTAKPYSGDLGPGSIIHLKMQDEHISGVREPKASPESQALAAKAKHDEIVMRQKNQNPANSARLPSPNPELINRQYNSPLPLYSAENVQEAMMPQVSPSHTPTIKPAPTPSSSAAAAEASKALRKLSSPIPANKPAQVILTPSKEYNPQSSATWRALQETDAPVDPQKVANYTSLKEHDPIYSEVYAAPVAPKPGQRPQPRTNALPGPRSPVSELLPSSYKAATNSVDPQDLQRSLLSPPKIGPSAVQEAAMAESKPMNHQMTTEPIKIPLYEDEYDQPVMKAPRRPGGPKTNSIGGRRKIAQTASFNKLMMDVLGE